MIGKKHIKNCRLLPQDIKKMVGKGSPRKNQSPSNIRTSYDPSKKLLLPKKMTNGETYTEITFEPLTYPTISTYGGKIFYGNPSNEKLAKDSRVLQEKNGSPTTGPHKLSTTESPKNRLSYVDSNTHKTTPKSSADTTESYAATTGGMWKDYSIFE